MRRLFGCCSFKAGFVLRRIDRAAGCVNAFLLAAALDLGMLDLCFFPAARQTYEQLAAHAQTFQVFGLEIAVARLDDIIESKTAAGRNKDLRALPTLRMLQERLHGRRSR